jgi:hypothetical protein
VSRSESKRERVRETAGLAHPPYRLHRYLTSVERHGSFTLVSTVASCAVMGCLLNYLLFLCTNFNSALTTTIVGVLKSVVAVILGACMRACTALRARVHWLSPHRHISLRHLLTLNPSHILLLLSSLCLHAPHERQPGFFLLGGVSFSAVNVAGISLNTIGGVWYTAFKYYERHGVPPPPEAKLLRP